MIWNKLAFLFLFIGTACCGKIYNFKGANIPPDVKTFSVNMFENNANIVNPELAIQLTDRLKNKFQSQTSLNLISNNGDYEFSGSIAEYKIEPVTLSNNTTVSQNRFTISVSLKFACALHPEKDLTKNYSNFINFDAATNFSSVEKGFANEILDNIIQQIFTDIALDW